MRLYRASLLMLVLLFATLSTVAAQTNCALSPRLTVGQRGQVLGTSPNNLREEPARAAARTGSIPGAGIFVVVAGPECEGATGIQWWQVEYEGQVGWTAEGDSGEYFLEPLHPALLYLAIEYNAPIGTEGRDDLVLFDLVTGENRVLTADIPTALPGDLPWRIHQFSWTPEGDRIAFTLEIHVPFLEQVDQSVYLMNADGSGKCLLAENATVVESGLFVVEPIELQGDDGAPLDFPACENPPEGTASGWRVAIEPVRQAVAVNLATGERIQLTVPQRDRALYGGVVSPDGTTTAIRLEDDVDFSALYLIPLENPADAQRVTLSGEPTGGLSWSPNGDALLAAARDRENGDRLLIRLDVAEGTETVLYRDDNVIEVTSPKWSPDGNSVAFTAAAEPAPGEFEPRVHLVHADGSGGQQLNTSATVGPVLWRPE